MEVSSDGPIILERCRSCTGVRWSISWFGAEPGRALESAQNDSPSLHQLHVRGGQGASASDLKSKDMQQYCFFLVEVLCLL